MVEQIAVTRDDAPRFGLIIVGTDDGVRSGVIGESLGEAREVVPAQQDIRVGKNKDPACCRASCGVPGGRDAGTVRMGEDFADRRFGRVEDRGIRANLVPYRELEAQLVAVAGDVAARAEETGRPRRFLVVHQLQRYRALRRNEDDFSFGASDAPPTPDKLLAGIVREGPVAGVHVVVSCDTLASLQRAFDRNALRLGWYGFTHGGDSVAHAIAETVELVKTYSTEKSGAFVNAVLDRVAKTAGAA